MWQVVYGTSNLLNAWNPDATSEIRAYQHPIMPRLPACVVSIRELRNARPGRRISSDGARVAASSIRPCFRGHRVRAGESGFFATAVSDRGDGYFEHRAS